MKNVKIRPTPEIDTACTSTGGEATMTTLLIQTDSIPLTVNLPAIDQMTLAQFYEFCQAKGDL
jgi:hypothetical protein